MDKIDVLFSSVKWRYEKYENNITDAARQFRALNFKLHNISNNDKQIASEIGTLVQLLQKQLDELLVFNKKTCDLKQDIIAAKTDTERLRNQNEETSRELSTKLKNLKNNQKEAENQKKKLEKERDEEQEKLNSFERKNRNLETGKTEAAVTSIVFGYIAGGLLMAGVVFPPLWITAGIVGAGEISAAVLFGVFHSMKESQEKLDGISQQIQRYNNNITSRQVEINNVKRELEQKTKTLKEAQMDIEDAAKSITALDNYSKKIDLWIEQLNQWISFLIKIKPEAERIQGHVGFNEKALQRAIGDFKLLMNSPETKKIEESAQLPSTFSILFVYD